MSHRRGRAPGAPAASLDAELPGHGRRSPQAPRGRARPRAPSAVRHGRAAPPLVGAVRGAGPRARSARSLAGRAARVGCARRCGAPVPSRPVPSRSGIPGRMVSAPSPPRAPFLPPPPPSPSAPCCRHRGLCKPPAGSAPAQAVAAARLCRITHSGAAQREKHGDWQNASPALGNAWFFLAQLTELRIVALLEWHRPGPEVEPERDLHKSDVE